MARLAWFVIVGTLTTQHDISADEGRTRRVGTDSEIARAVSDSKPGDTVLIADGIYHEPLQVKKSGKGQQLLTIKAEHSRKAVFSRMGQAAQIDGSFLRIEGLVFDSQYGNCSGVRASGNGLHFLDCEIRRPGSSGGKGGGDGLQFSDSADGLVEKCHIHHCLATKDGERVDSHGIRFTNSHDMIVRGCFIDLVSGDCVQADPNREAWDNILIESCKLSGGKGAAGDPFSHPGYEAGRYTAENAVDTKVKKGSRPRITVRDCEAYGFRGIGNAAAFNIKETCDAVIDRCTISDCEIGLRIRGPAHARVTNCVLFDNDTHCRYEDHVPHLLIAHCTFGLATGKGRGVFQEQRPSPDLQVLGCLFLDEKPKQARDRSNRLMAVTGFTGPKMGDYRLALPAPTGGKGPAAADPGVKVDRAGVTRPPDSIPDAGAYQFQSK